MYNVYSALSLCFEKLNEFDIHMHDGQRKCRIECNTSKMLGLAFDFKPSKFDTLNTLDTVLQSFLHCSTALFAMVQCVSYGKSNTHTRKNGTAATHIPKN